MTKKATYSKMAKHLFQPGKSGNPMGRPAGFKGLARKIRAATDDGDVLVAFALTVFDGTHKALGHNIAARMEAFKWLSDRGWGKAPQLVEVHNASDTALAPPDLSQCTDEELEVMSRAAALVDRLSSRKKVIDV